MLPRNAQRVRQRETGGLAVTLSRIPGQTSARTLTTPLVFQVAPIDQFGWEVAYNWTDYDTISAGQFTSDGGKRLRTLTVNSMVMAFNAPWASFTDGASNEAYAGESPDPLEVAKQLDALVSSGEPMMLTVLGANDFEPELEMPVTMRRANIQERAGEPDARYFDIDFVEYRVSTITRRGYGYKHDLPATVRINKDGVAIEFLRDGEKLKEKQRHRIGTKSKPATLRKLSKHFYGSTKFWKRIAAKNNLKIKNWGPDESLERLYRNRKRKNKDVRLVIPPRPKTPPKKDGNKN